MEIIEENLLDEYYFLVKRIKGMSLSLNDFFEADSFYISYIFRKELELVKEEEKEYKKMEMQSNNTNSSGSTIPLKQEDSPNAVMMYEAYFEE